MVRGKSEAAVKEAGEDLIKEKEQKQEMQGGSSGAEGKTQSLPVQLEVRIHSIRPNESIRANASVNINGAFAIRGIKVVVGSNGLFVSMPSYKSGNEYKDICFPITAQCRKQLQDSVLGAYEQAVAQGQNSVQKHPDMQQAAPEGQTVSMAAM